MSVVVAGLGGDDLDLGNEELCACGLSGKTQGGFGGIFAVEVFVRAWDEERAKQVIAEHTHPKGPVVA